MSIHRTIEKWHGCHSKKTHQKEVEDAGVAQERAKNEEHACKHPGGDGRHSFHIGRCVVDGVEDVDQDQEQGDQ